jgi:hypothetical protein
MTIKDSNIGYVTSKVRTAHVSVGLSTRNLYQSGFTI